MSSIALDFVALQSTIYIIYIPIIGHMYAYIFRYSCLTLSKYHATKECFDSKHCLIAKVFVQRKINAPAWILFAKSTIGSLMFVPMSCWQCCCSCLQHSGTEAKRVTCLSILGSCALCSLQIVESWVISTHVCLIVMFWTEKPLHPSLLLYITQQLAVQVWERIWLIVKCLASWSSLLVKKWLFWFFALTSIVKSILILLMQHHCQQVYCFHFILDFCLDCLRWSCHQCKNQ